MNAAVADGSIASSNRGLVTVTAGADHAVELLLAALHRDGCVIMKNAATTEQCQALLSDLQPYSEDVGGATVGCVLARSAASWPFAAQPQLVEVVEGLLGRQLLVMGDTELAQAVAAHKGGTPTAVVDNTGSGNGTSGSGNDAAAAAPAADVDTEALPPRFPWQIHVALTIPKQSGGGPQELHRDGDLTLLDLGKRGFEHAVSTIWALDGDFTEERGATRAIPGSHVWPRVRRKLFQN